MDTADLREGIYPAGALGPYEEIPALRQSRLKPISRSPLHCKAGISVEGPPEKPYMRLGTVVHTAVLEPARLDRDFAVYVPPDGKTDRFAGKAFEDFCDATAPRRVIKARERDEAVRIAAEVRRNKLAQRYLQRGAANTVIVWRELVNSIPIWCKAELDWLSLSVPDVMCELKTSNSIAPSVFAQRFASLGYDVQAAFYCRGYRKVTGRDLYAKCIAVEAIEPHDVIVYDLAEAIDVGAEYVDEYLAKYAECLAADEWPGQFPDSEVSLQLPMWRRPGEEDDLAALGLVAGEEAAP